jgi:diacylglycerol kinase (ATP)
MHVLVVANPISGGREGSRRVHELARVLEARGHAVDLRWTRGPGDAHAIARSADVAVERLVVAGGDGTLNEVLNGVHDPSEVPLAQLPLGTANLLGKQFGLSRDPDETASRIERGAVRRLDMGRLGERRFLAVASCGADAMVTERIGRSRSGQLGYRGYLLPIGRMLWHYQTPRLSVSIDDEEAPLSGGLVIAAKVRIFGGLFRLADDAAPESGVFHVCVFGGGRVPDLLRYALAGLLGQVARLGDVVFTRGRRIRIDSELPVPVEVDGDACGTTPAQLDLVPAHVPFVVGPAG